MYFRYNKINVGPGITRYEKQEEISLFGCNIGIIPQLLKPKVPENQVEPWAWHIDVITELVQFPNYPQNTLIIDVKPDQKIKLSLYEVTDIWGYSSFGWTPFLLRLNGLFVDSVPQDGNREIFERKDEDIDSPIYTFLYSNGSVKDGKLCGTWSPPPQSSTNGPLLWPEVLKYFQQCIKKSE